MNTRLQHSHLSSQTTSLISLIQCIRQAQKCHSSSVGVVRKIPTKFLIHKSDDELDEIMGHHELLEILEEQHQ